MPENWTGERLETFILNETAIEHLHRYAMAADIVKDKIVLDIACGEGYGSYQLSKMAKSVTGIDIDEATIEQAQKKYNHGKLQFAKGDICQIPVADASIDVIVSFETLEHVADHDQVVKEFKRVLKADGKLILSTPEKKMHSDLNTIKSKFHIKELYEEEFKNLLSSSFRNIQYLYQSSFFTSVLLPVEPSHTGIQFYEGDFNKLIRRQGMDPRFIIAIASDIPITLKPSVSLFRGELIFEDAIKQERESILKSITYKVGNFILLPFKIIKKAFIK